MDIKVVDFNKLFQQRILNNLLIFKAQSGKIYDLTKVILRIEADVVNLITSLPHCDIPTKDLEMAMDDYWDANYFIEYKVKDLLIDIAVADIDEILHRIAHILSLFYKLNTVIKPMENNELVIQIKFYPL